MGRQEYFYVLWFWASKGRQPNHRVTGDKSSKRMWTLVLMWCPLVKIVFFCTYPKFEKKEILLCSGVRRLSITRSSCVQRLVSRYFGMILSRSLRRRTEMGISESRGWYLDRTVISSLFKQQNPGCYCTYSIYHISLTAWTNSVQVPVSRNQIYMCEFAGDVNIQRILGIGTALDQPGPENFPEGRVHAMMYGFLSVFVEDKWQ